MMEPRIQQIIRQFPENGLKQILTRPANVHDLLSLAQTPMLARLDIPALRVDPTTYVTAEYRHVSSDLVLTLPLRPSARGRPRQRLLLTILIELQMQPDRLMLVRLLEYLAQIWKHQIKQYGEKHKSLASVKLRPVLPVVLHTGSYSWEQLGTLIDLMDDAEDFRAMTPAFRPLLVSLPNRTEEDLETQGGVFGQVLALLKARKTGRTTFAQRLDRTVTRVEELKGPERLRRLELLDYIEALVYHARETSEHVPLRERIDAALHHDEDRLEVNMVRRTLADVHREEGALAANKQTLLKLLRLRFKSLPTAIEQTIQASHDAEQLSEWLERFATAQDLEAVGILATN